MSGIPENVASTLRALEGLYRRSLGNFDSERSHHLTTGLVYLKYVMDNETDVPGDLRWSSLTSVADSPAIGEIVDDATARVEWVIPSTVGLFPRGYGDESVDQFHLGQSVLDLAAVNLSMEACRGVDLVGRIHEHLLVRGQLLANDRSESDISAMLNGFYNRQSSNH